MMLGGKFFVFLVAITVQTVACNDGFTNVAGTQVMFVKDLMTFADAEKNCEEKGAKLVEIWTSEEWKEIKGWLKLQEATYHWSWIGLTDTKEKEVFVWSSGSPLSPNISNVVWAPGRQPQADSQHCAAIWSHYGLITRGAYHERCNRKFHHVCQRRVWNGQELTTAEKIASNGEKPTQSFLEVNVIYLVMFGILIVLLICILAFSVLRHAKRKRPRPEDTVFLHEISAV